MKHPARLGLVGLFILGATIVFALSIEEKPKDASSPSARGEEGNPSQADTGFGDSASFVLDTRVQDEFWVVR